MIAVFETPTSGKISIHDRTVDDVATGTRIAAVHRNLGFVFQNYALWPHLTVREIVGFGPMMQRLTKTERTHRVVEALRTLGITAYGASIHQNCPAASSSASRLPVLWPHNHRSCY